MKSEALFMQRLGGYTQNPNLEQEEGHLHTFATLILSNILLAVFMTARRRLSLPILLGEIHIKWRYENVRSPRVRILCARSKIRRRPRTPREAEGEPLS